MAETDNLLPRQVHWPFDRGQFLISTSLRSYRVVLPQLPCLPANKEIVWMSDVE